MPTPADEALHPCEDLLFLQWLPATTLLPVPPAEESHRPPIAVEWQMTTGVVALFCSRPDTFEVERPFIPETWWAELLYRPDHCVHTECGHLRPYPEALEAARLMQAVARDEPSPKTHYFLPDAARRTALLRSAQFKNKQRRLFN